MIKNFGEIKTDVIVKLGISTTTAFYTDDILNDWIQQAHRWATAHKKWVFTEGRQSTTYTGVEEWNFEGLKSDSIRTLTIDDKLFQKIKFQDYLIFKEKEPDSNDRVYTDFNRTIFVNPKSGLSGTMTVYAQYTPVT